MNSPRPVTAVCISAVFFAGIFSGCSKGCATPAPAAPPPPKCATEVLIAKHTPHAPTLDGEAKEAAWLEATITPPFFDDKGAPGRPHTEVRATWNADALYLLFYAGDEDLELDDWMGATLTGGNGKPVSFKIAPNGAIDGPIELQAGVDRDGTLADAGDDDEEWVVELAVPWSLLGRADEVKASFGRSDKPKDAARRELRWPAPCEGQPGAGVIRLQAPPRVPAQGKE